MEDKAVIIMSGGMDSATLAYHLKDQMPHTEFHYLTFDYGQRHVKEIGYALDLGRKLEAYRHNVINLQDLGELLFVSGSVLVDPRTDVPEGHYAEETMKVTVVPNRNSIMLAIAVAAAVAVKANMVAAGMHAGDHFIYPDCRPGFLDAFNQAEIIANEGFWGGHIVAPFIKMTKADIVSLGDSLRVPWEMTWSCYKGGQFHCGKCGTCVERREAFSLAGVVDPTEYE
jgi:7-cyano-7-deazaguanine synthase